MIVDIVCSLYNGARYLPEFADSLRRQTHTDWRLWMRDDGSTDETARTARLLADADPRMRLLTDATARRGVTASFGWLVDQVPSDASFIMFADQDDVWLADKIERTLGAMRRAGGERAQPMLVHTDLVVVNEALDTIHESFWRFAGIDPTATSMNRIAVRNVVTGATAMINRALRELAAPIPADAVLHDWWCACVAAAFGKVVAVSQPTILYRQHGANTVGARRWDFHFRDLPSALARARDGAAEFRRGLAGTAAQARAMLARYEDRLSDADRRFLAAYAEIPRRSFLRRKIDLLRYRTWPNQGVLRRLAVVLRG